jgi:hypothetical protein
MSIVVVNRKNPLPIGYGNRHVFYCGRGTPLGNKFVMYDETQRNEVCDKYQEYFDQFVLRPQELTEPVDIDQSRAMISMLKEIIEAVRYFDTVFLECFCAPKRCHCDTIKSYIIGA